MATNTDPVFIDRLRTGRVSDREWEQWQFDRLTFLYADRVGTVTNTGQPDRDGDCQPAADRHANANHDHGALRQPDAHTAMRGRGERSVRPMEPDPDPHAAGGAAGPDRFFLFGDDGAVLPEGGG